MIVCCGSAIYAAPTAPTIPALRECVDRGRTRVQAMLDDKSLYVPLVESRIQ